MIMITSSNYIDRAEHKTSIEFSNEGIKAVTATFTVGSGEVWFVGFVYEPTENSNK